GDRAPAAAGQLPLLHLARDAVGVDETEGLLVADDLPLEVLRLAVEEEAIVLAHVGAEEAVGAVGRGDGAHAAKRRYVSPRQIALGRVLEAVAEGRRPLPGGGGGGRGEGLEEG